MHENCNNNGGHGGCKLVGGCSSIDAQHRNRNRNAKE
jgi:hypothetical protein